MREINFEDVRPGDVARSNGKELEVTWCGKNRIDVGFEADKFLSKNTADALGVTFWREERTLPDYPGAWVWSNDVGHAVRALTYKGGGRPWLTADHDDPWKTYDGVLEWLGPDWEEITMPPSREWTPVDTDQIRDGDFVRFEWSDGDAVESAVIVNGREIEFTMYVNGRDISDESGQWFKREEQDNASE